MTSSTRLRDRIAATSPTLSPAQRRVARLVDESPDVVAFGTVAEVASAASTSPQTVLRLAARLGHGGFPELQAQVRSEMMALLPPAAARIRRPSLGDRPTEVAAADGANVEASLGVDADVLAAVAGRLAAARAVRVVVAESWTGVGRLLVDHLGQLRAGVELVDGPPTRVARLLAELGPDDVVLAADVRRYERWVLDAVDQAVAAEVPVIGVSDGPTAPLLARATHRLVVAVASPGPFESPTGVVALFHLLVTEVSAHLRDEAQLRLDTVERAWAADGSLVDDDA